MKGRRKRGVAAVFMAMLMMVGLVPSDFTLVTADAADKTYILNAADLSLTEYTAGNTFDCGTDSYFKLNPTASDKGIKITANSKTFNVDESEIAVSNRIQLQKNKVNTIDFTVTAGNTAKVTACVISSNSAGDAVMVLMDADGTVKYGSADTTSAPGTYTKGKSEVIFNDVEAGSYKLGTASDSPKQANVYYIKVEETKAGDATGTAPVISGATASDKGDGNVEVSWTESTAAAGDGKVVAEVSSDGSKYTSVILTDEDIAARKFTYKMQSSGSYTFKLYGKLGSTTNTEVVTSPAIVYTRELAKPSVTAKAGDGKITLSWKAVDEATGYKVKIMNGSTTVVNDETTTELTFVKDGLTNLEEYVCTVTAVRNSDTAVSDSVKCMPYKPIDTSSAIPGMSIVNQAEDAQLSIQRTAGSINISQPATSGGIASGKLSNMSYIVTPDKLSGDFKLTADVVLPVIPEKGRGIFIGAVTDTASDKPYIGGLYIRGDNNGEFNVYRTKNQASYNNGGSAKGKPAAGKKYSVEVTKAGTAFNIIVKDGNTELVNNSWEILADGDGKALSNKLADPVYVGIAACGASAELSNIKITQGSTDVFDSSKLTGEFSSFVDNWDKVEAPVISVAGDKDKMTVTSDCVIGALGAGKVEVTMKDAAGKVVDKQSTSAMGSQQTFEFAPDKSGAYTFTAVATRTADDAEKTSNTVTVNNFTATLHGPENVTATSQGNGSVKVEWSAYSEAVNGYRVSYKAEGAADYTVAGTTNETSLLVSGLTVGTRYEFKVEALRGAEAKETTVAAVASADAKYKWEFAAFGSSTDKNNNTYTGDANEGSVQLSTKGSKGKIVPNSTDGIAFYYTKIPVASNFTLKAKVKIDEWTLTNGQEGAGLMVADRVGTHGDSTAFWNNSYMALGSKIEYYYDEETGEISDAGSKISMKWGLGVIAKSNVTQENLPRLNAGDTDTVNNEFKTETVTLETSAAKLGTGTYNVFGNSTNTPVSDGLTPLTEYYLTIQKNNTGYFVTYSDVNGNPIKTQKYYDTEALNHLDKDYVYAGFFTSRAATATFSDISVTLTDPANDPPAEAKPIKYVTPSYTVTSSSTSGTDDYELMFLSSADGTLSIGGTDVKNVKVKAGETFVKVVKLIRGENRFYIAFTPDKDFVPKKGDRLTSYDTYEFTHVVTFKTYGATGEAIWVAPDGSNLGDGTKQNPLDIYTAIKYVHPGQQIILKGGRYHLYSTVKVDRGNDGSADKKIYMIADTQADERPVLDFHGSCAGMILAGDYWYFKGFDVTNSANAQKGVQVSGSNCVLDQINTYHNGNTGIQISRLLSSDEWNDWPANNLILNCTSYGNADAGYEDADGFAAKLTIGDGNVFDGCISHHNADDGWDLFAKVETGKIGSVTIKNCVAYANGYLEDGTNAGNGNGFKMGGESLSGYHKLINSVAYNNKAKGIDSNSCPDIQVENSTTFNNGSYNVAFYTNTAANTDFSANGILSFRKDTSVEEQFKTKGTQDMSKINANNNYYWSTGTLDSRNAAGATVSESWFISLDTSIVPTRNADGTINMNGLLVLTDAAPADTGARMTGTKSADIAELPAVLPPEDDPEEKEEETPAITDTSVESGLNVIGLNVGVKADEGTVIKNAAGQVVTAGDVYVKATPVAATQADAEAILEVIKTKELKLADNAAIDYFEVQLVDAAGNPLTFDGSIVITFVYPDGTSAASHAFTVLHLLKSGELDIMEPSLSDAGISVSVTELSPFAVVYMEKAEDGTSQQAVISAATGDRTPIIPIAIILLASIAAIGACFVVSRKKKA